jgi:hypothetical protein
MRSHQHTEVQEFHHQSHDLPNPKSGIFTNLDKSFWIKYSKENWTE